MVINNSSNRFYIQTFNAMIKVSDKEFNDCCHRCGRLAEELKETLFEMEKIHKKVTDIMIKTHLYRQELLNTVDTKEEETDGDI